METRVIPLELVDDVLGKLEFSGDKLAHGYQGFDDTDQAELRSEVNNRLVAFFECWPPLKPAWRPTVESGARVGLVQRKIILAS